jgi:hypothetical protein
MGTVLVIALAMATDPIRLGVTLLLITRPRPIRNLMLYWLGAMFVGVSSAVVVLTLLSDFAPSLLRNMSSIAATPTARHAQIVLGLLALLIAAFISTGLPIRQRFGLQVPVPVELPVPVGVGADPTSLLVQPAPVTGISQLFGRARGAMNRESPWVAVAAGLGTGPAPVEYLVALVAILAAGGGIGRQICAAVVFNLIMLTVCEITLLCYLVAPNRTESIIGILNTWVASHRRHIVSVIVGVAGVCLVVTGSK